MIFVDTSAFYALVDEGDKNHPHATSIYKKLARTNTPLVTTNYVIGETYTLVMARLGTKIALQVVENLKESRLLEKVHIGEDIEEKAFQLLKKHSDKNFSFVDTASFAFMKSKGLEKVFAFDKHFTQAGFKRVY